MRRLTILTTLALTAVLAFAAGCGGDDESDDSAGSPKGTFVGKVGGTDAFIAVNSDGKQVGGYLCDSKDVAVWFGASKLSDGKGDLVSRTGDRLGEATLDGDSASGEVTVDGKTHSFDAQLATGEAGLYRASESGKFAVVGNVETTWIVLADGSERGAKGPWIDPSTDPVAPRPAPKFKPTAAQPWIDPEIDL